MPSADLDAYAHDAVVRDGRTVHIRPVRPDDAEDLLEMWQRLSPETVRRRFFAPRRMDREQIRYFSDVDYDRRFVFVAETGGRIVGLSQFDRLGDGSTAEFAVIVEDAEQGRGIGTALLRALVAPAEDQGVTGFVGDVLAENTPMLRMLRDAGLQPVVTTSGPVVHTTFPSTPTEAFLSSVDEQDRKAAVAALSAVLTPMSIAVVGASRDPTSIGGLVFGNLLRGRFAGPVYPVNPAADHVQSVAAYTSVADCPTVPELIVVCVPAAGVAEVVDEAARLGTKAAVIISAGFSDAGPEGAELERQLMEVVRSYGLRVVGPNSMGVVNAGADLRMNATFSAAFPAPGRVAFCSHSGALGLAVLSTASRLGLGISSFASVGNRSDISGNDLLQYWESDSETDLVLLYLESFGNPRKFGRIARRIGRRKPIVAVKAGRSELGGVTASGDPAAAAAGDVAVEALFRQAGVIRTDTLEQMFNVASVLANQPVPRGNRVAVLANGGGPGVLAADACRSQGLRVPALASRAVERLRELLVGEGDIGQPVILSSSAPAEHYGRAMRILAADSNVDALLVLFIPPAVTEPDEIAREMAAVRRDVDPDIPIVSVFMSERGLPAALAEARIPSFGFPEDAAEVLGHLARYGLWRSKPLGNVVKVDDADADAAHAVVEDALREPAPGVQEWWLDAVRTDRLLSAFGITTAPALVVHSPDEAAQAQLKLGVPVAVKSAAPVRKTKLGGVRLGLTRPERVAGAVGDITAELQAAGRGDLVTHGFLVQEMIPDGVETVVRVSHHETFGPILQLGMGGPLAELLGDVSVRIHPLTDVDVEEMLTSLRGYPLLTGYQGSGAVDVEALKTLLFRVSAMIQEVFEIHQLDLNPVFVRRHGVAAVDARINLSREHQRPRR